ncbi:MAG: poly(R)-hydroxyalkanoic acid synthase subunit PhaE [Actinomycetota bacterium]|nr:poly(R)-hydroxyalkanoic acid synthase subunit PhaE [Actinomycetota bacterium]
MQESGAAWSEMWRAWQRMQAEAYRGWMETWLGAWGQRGRTEEGGGEKGAGTPGDLYRQWMDFMREMMERFVPPAQGVGPDTFAKMFQSADVYTHLYAMWAGMYERYRRAVGEGGELDLKALGGMLEEWGEEYRELVRKVFAPALPEQLQWIAELYSGEIPLMAAGLLAKIWAPWYDFARETVARGMSPEGPSPQTAVELYEGWRKAYEESFGRLLRAPAMGYYREAAEKLVRAVDSLNEFNLVLSEFYASLQGAGSRGFEKLQERLAAMQAEGKQEPMSFRDLYRLWWQTNEDIYIELFRTEEFSRLLGSLVDRGMQFRRAFQAYVEEITKELPFPNRSEMDHLYRTVDRLKREVRALKKELAALKAAEEGE